MEEMEGSPQDVIKLNAGKAGMDGLDLEKINKIINETSKGSKFYEHKKKKQEEMGRRVMEMKDRMLSLSPTIISKAEKQVDQLIQQLEEKRNLSNYIVHIDMDAFFASVEMRDNPSLRDVPMAVGSHSMLSTSNYHSRKYGIRSGMPGFIAKKLCPQLVIVPVNFEKYTAASKEFEQALEEYDKETLSVSMDEASLDITKCLAERNSMASDKSAITPAELVHEIRQKVFERTKLTCSAGIAANGFLAKVCSDVNKPNNQFFLECSVPAIEGFLKDLPVGKVCGIGPVTVEMLKGLGIHKCGDLWEKRGIIQQLFKPATSSFLIRVSKGLSSSFFTSESSTEDVRKSVSCERTFGKATKEELKQMCRALSEELHRDLEQKEATGKTITLKIKTIEFTVKTRARTLSEFTNAESVIFDNAWSIYNSYEKEFPNLQLRLMGVRMSNLRFDDDERDEKKQQTLSQMFSKASSSSASKRQYVCPCCEEDFASLGEIDMHMNDCLLDSESDETSSNDMNDRTNANIPTATLSGNVQNYPEKEEAIPSTSTHQEPQNQQYPVTATCPVCNRNFKFRSTEEVDRKMNVHMDTCLSVDTVKQAIREEGLKYLKEKSEIASKEASPVVDNQTPQTSSSSTSTSTTAPTHLEIDNASTSSASSSKEQLHNSTTLKRPLDRKSTPKSSKPSSKKLRSLPIDAYFIRRNESS